jgi:hypothetical protein
MKINTITLALGLMGISSLAQAALTSQSALVAFDTSASVSATANSVASASASNDGLLLTTLDIGQFDAAQGVLLGVQLHLDSSRNQTISGIGMKNNGPGRTANGSGTSTGLLSGAGLSEAFSPAGVSGSGCTLAMGPTGAISCNWGPDTTMPVTTQSSSAVDGAHLNAYAGNGNVAVALSLPQFSATSTLSRTQGQASSAETTYNLGWSGSVLAEYSYLRHAAASFSSDGLTNALNLDFGTLDQGSSVSPLAFELFNLADADRTGLDLDSIVGSGDIAVLGTDLNLFSNLAQGNGQHFGAWLDTSSAGDFTAQYILTLSDSDVGASSTRLNQQLTITLHANVAAVPEPETYALLLAGLGLVGVMARRQQS